MGVIRGKHCHPCGSGAFLSVYQIAVKNGFRGTEKEWLNAIGTVRIIQVTERSGGTFECNASLGTARGYIEDGFIPVLVYEGIPAILSDMADDYLAFSTQVIRTADGDVYDLYILSGREDTVETVQVSGSGSGGAIGPGSVTYAMLHANVRAALDKADSAYQKPSEGIPGTDMTEAVQASLAKADSALQAHQSLAGLIPRSAQATKTVNHTQEVAVDPSGKLYIEPVTAGEAEIEEHTEVLTMTYYDGDNYCSMTSEEIYELLDEATKAVILIDRAGRQCNLIVPPSLESNAYTDAKFWTYDNTGTDLVIYSVNASGIVSSATISLNELYSLPAGGIPKTDLASAVQASLALADSAIQSHQSLSGMVPRNQQASKTVNHTQAVAIDGNGKLWVEPTSSGESSGGSSNTELITMTEYDGSDYASLEAEEIYDILDAGAKNIVLIDRAGRQCSLIVPPEEVSNDYSVAKFWTFNDTATGLIIYSVGDDGYTTSTTVTLTGFYTKPSGGIPSTDLASAVQTSLGKADTAYQKPSGGIPSTDLASAVQSALSTKILTMTQSGSTYTYGTANFTFASLDDLIAIIQSGEVVWLSNTTTGSVYRGVNIRGATTTGRVTFAGVTQESDSADPVVEVFIIDGSMNITKKVLKELPASTSNDSGKYLKVNSSGNAEWGSAPSGSSVPDVVYINLDLTNPTAPTITSVTDSSNQALSLSGLATKLASGPVRILSPVDQNGTVFEWEVCGQSTTKIAVCTTVPETNDNYYHVASLTETSNVLGGTIKTQKLGTGSVNPPSGVTKTNTEMGTGFSVSPNIIYTVSGSCSGFTLTNSSYVGIRGYCAEIRLTVGSTAISSPTWPSGFNFMNGWDGKFSANTYYDILIDDAGNVFHSERAVS